MAFTDQPKKDMYILYEEKEYYIMDRMYKTQGRQGGLFILKLKSLETGNNLTVTLKSGAKVEEIEPLTKEVQYLYKDDASAYFMETTTFETIPMNLDVLGDYINYLKEGDKTLIIEYEGKILDVRRKASVNLKVISASEGVKGNSAGNPTKSVTVETGHTINVPLFVREGDIVSINTESGEYTGRING
jgi:elongation factor P